MTPSTLARYLARLRDKRSGLYMPELADYIEELRQEAERLRGGGEPVRGTRYRPAPSDGQAAHGGNDEWKANCESS